MKKKIQKTEKEMTVNELAILMMNGFDRLEQKLTQQIIDFRYETNDRFARLERGTDIRLDTAEHKLIILKNVIQDDLGVQVRW